jgi:hypothetical protein
VSKSIFEGKTLMYAARALGFRQKGYRVYILQDEEDRIGRRAAEDYELKRILRIHPEFKHFRVISAEEYYGIQIFRVRQPV